MLYMAVVRECLPARHAIAHTLFCLSASTTPYRKLSACRTSTYTEADKPCAGVLSGAFSRVRSNGEVWGENYHIVRAVATPVQKGDHFPPLFQNWKMGSEMETIAPTQCAASRSFRAYYLHIFFSPKNFKRYKLGTRQSTDGTLPPALRSV